MEAEMLLINETADRTIETPNAVMTRLAAPSVGSVALSTWRVRMASAITGPIHIIDQEQVWTVLSGALDVTVDDEKATVEAGQTLVLPAGAVRQIRTGARAAEALVSMPAKGQVTLPGSDEWKPLPWAV
jgi:quercetin dioxygenase-like cupin family protein